LLGLSHAVMILCEVRSNYTNSPFITSRYEDLKFLHDDSLNDPETIQMKGGMMEDMPVTKMLATSEDSRYFLFTYITIERPVYEIGYKIRQLPTHMQFSTADGNRKISGLYEVPQLELEQFKQLKIVK
jgi:hypothetical protein